MYYYCLIIVWCPYCPLTCYDSSPPDSPNVTAAHPTLSADLDGAVELDCAADGFPVPSLAWSREGYDFSKTLETKAATKVISTELVVLLFEEIDYIITIFYELYMSLQIKLTFSPFNIYIDDF